MNDVGSSREDPRLAPWGYVATLGWAIWAAFVVMAITVLSAKWLPGDWSQAGERYNGVMVAVMTIVTLPAEVAILAWAARLIRWSPIDYFALTRPRVPDLVLGLGCLAVISPIFDAVTYLLGRDIVSPFQIDIYVTARAAGALPLLLFAVVIVVPLGEEIAFRGFLFRGWVRKRADLVPAVFVISILWALLHVQYDWYGMLQIFCAGLLLGWLRWRTGSTMVTVLVHAAMNAVALIETMMVIPEP